MKNTTIVIILGAIAIILVGGVGLNLIPNPLDNDNLPDDAQGISSTCQCDYSDIEIHATLEALTNKSLNFLILQQYITNLDITMCHVDDISYTSLINEYKSKYQSEGLILHDTQDVSSTTWSARVGLWYTPDYSVIKTVSSIGGVAVTTIYGHDTVFLLASGDPGEWTSFWTWINS